MPDQAHGLRNLIFRLSETGKAPHEQPPHLLVVVGAKGGVGTTTTAVNVATTLAHQGRRVVLVDGHLPHGDATALAGMEQLGPRNVWDVMQGSCTATEALRTGPAGMMILAGSGADEPPHEVTAGGITRLQEQLESLQGRTDLIVLDAGAGDNLASSHFAPIADHLWVVTTCDGIAVMDAYATIKLMCGKQRPTRLALVTNQATHAELAMDVYDRVAQSCLRFLDLPLSHAGSVPSCDSITANATQPTVLATPTSPASQGLQRLAMQLTCEQDQQTSRAG